MPHSPLEIIENRSTNSNTRLPHPSARQGLDIALREFATIPGPPNRLATHTLPYTIQAAGYQACRLLS